MGNHQTHPPEAVQTHHHKPEPLRRPLPSRGGPMLGISRRLDNEHGYRIDSITKPYLNRKYHPNRGHRHVTMSHPKHGTQVGTHKWHYQVPYHSNLLSPLSGRNTKNARPIHNPEDKLTDHHTTRPSHPLSEDGQTKKKKKIGVHHPTTRRQSTLLDTPTCHIEQDT